MATRSAPWLSGGALPDDDELELTFADALFRAGRTREAASHFAAAHTAATSDGVRARVADGMRTLADHWDDDEAMLTDTPKAPAKNPAARAPPCSASSSRAGAASGRRARSAPTARRACSTRRWRKPPRPR